MLEDAPPSAREVRALAHQLLTWATHLTAHPESGREMTDEDRHDLVLGLALAAREARRLRMDIFPLVLLGNPNWDVMLDLFIGEMNGSRTSLDHMALSGDLRAPTVYESVDTMARLGLIERTQDRFDNRVIWLSLTATGRQGMYALFEQSAGFVRPIANRMPNLECAEV